MRKGGEWQGGPGARRRAPLAFLVVLATAGAVALVTPGQGSSPPTHGVTARRAATSPPTARLLLAGDVMLGRGVSQAAAADPGGLFEGVRFELASADYALANLESPLTRRPHDPAHGPNALEASPQSARLLASAGFDAMSVANNHAGDAGPATVSDTIRALARAGIAPVGASLTGEDVPRARIVSVRGLRVALLAFDAGGRAARADGLRPGVAAWSRTAARRAVERARPRADIVVVSLHGGAEYVPQTDPYLTRLATLLASWGADVVWGQGPHVVQPVHVIDPNHDGRPTIVATSLGNLVFDQHLPATERGALLEVVVGRSGVRAFRVGHVRARAPVEFRGWMPPRGDAVALHGGWWALAQPIVPAGRRPANLHGFQGQVVDAAIGHPTDAAGRQVVVAFRRLFRRTNVSPLIPRRELVDPHGLSAHLGVYEARGLRQIWVAGTLLRPVSRVAACDGAIAVAYSTLDTPGTIATGAWRWGGFGFLSLPELAGPGVPACADLDGDGLLDPVVLERSSP